MIPEVRVGRCARSGAAVSTLVFALTLALSEPTQGGTEPDTEVRLDVVGTEFRLTLPDGRVLSGRDLVGAVFEVDDAAGRRIVVRIDGVARDPKDASGETTLYALKRYEAERGVWVDYCRQDADGLAMGFPLAGRWTSTGAHLPSAEAFTLACTSGASAKCVRLGYKPWKTAADGTRLWPYHQACVRMVRADYCGDGTPRTRAGRAIAVTDRLGIQKAAVAGMAFEAAWGADGAVCVRRVRIPELISLDALVRACPALSGRVGSACTKARALQDGRTLLLNRS